MAEEGKKEERVVEEEKKEEDILGDAINKLYIEVDETGSGVEKFYFWILTFIRSTPPSGISLPNYQYKISKIKDIFSASETGAYFGNIEQRKGLQQEKVAQYMATLGKMTRDLFQIIRELRIIEERLTYYDRSTPKDKDGKPIEDWEEAEIALKSIWIDLVEGGSKNPTSVLGLGSQVGFVILPDLFFTIHPQNRKKVKYDMGELAKRGINRKIREVLGRKLWQYLDWKEKTGKEIRTRKNFVLKFLRQHYNVMKMYITWLKPYLRNIKKLQGNQEDYAEVVTGFDTSKIELEILAKKEKTGKEKQNVFPCILVKFDYTAIPQMAYQEEYQRGAVHSGNSKIWFEAYTLTDEQINKYKKQKDDEDMELIASVYESMDSLKEDLKKYLEEEGEKWHSEDEKKEEEKKNSLLSFFPDMYDNFSSIFKGFKEIFTPNIKSETQKQQAHWKFKDEEAEAKSNAEIGLWILYDVFKKAHRMFTW
ncbi:hypothetical protein CL617_01365 [archaeon]|nr:hypothetical protein [archaeon]|tara:strand:- start:5090 stop:6526 length:1437 start_codon:yes stop_codon:yes gene_type:complete